MSRYPAPERSVASAPPKARRAPHSRPVGSRRPTTPPPEPLVSEAEREFIKAMHDYKQSSGRMFPTWSEVLEVLKALGYAKNL